MNSPVNHAEKILSALDERLNTVVELTLYGRAALSLGFPSSPVEMALSRDVDAVFWVGQAQELANTTNFWEAVEGVNRFFAEQELYISHFFEETQVILRPQWRQERVKIPGTWERLDLFRLGDVDLLLSKMMRDDPLDLRDALFIARSAGMKKEAIELALKQAHVPNVPEIREQFQICQKKFLQKWKGENGRFGSGLNA